MKISRHPTKIQIRNKRTKYIVNIYIDGEHAIRVIRNSWSQANQMANSITAYLKLLQRKKEIDESSSV